MADKKKNKISKLSGKGFRKRAGTQSPKPELRKTVGEVKEAMLAMQNTVRFLMMRLGEIEKKRKEDAEFNLALMISLNGIANAIIEKKLLNAEELAALHECIITLEQAGDTKENQVEMLAKFISEKTLLTMADLEAGREKAAQEFKESLESRKKLQEEEAAKKAEEAKTAAEQPTEATDTKELDQTASPATGGTECPPEPTAVASVEG